MYEVTMPYERFNELIEAENKLKEILSDEKEEVIKDYEEIPLLMSKAEIEFGSAIKDIVLKSNRIKDRYYYGGEVVAILKDGKFNVNASTICQFLNSYSTPKMFSLELGNSNTIIRFRKRIKTRLIRLEEGVYRSFYVVNNRFLEQLRVFDDVHNHDKMNRDKFIYRNDTSHIREVH